MPANDLLTEIHNAKQRMPLILPPEAVDTWLIGTPEQAKALLVPYPSELMRAHPVSKRVNKPENDDRNCWRWWRRRSGRDVVWTSAQLRRARPGMQRLVHTNLAKMSQPPPTSTLASQITSRRNARSASASFV
jgi:hypothetical protein